MSETISDLKNRLRAKKDSLLKQVKAIDLDLEALDRMISTAGLPSISHNAKGDGSIFRPELSGSVIPRQEGIFERIRSAIKSKDGAFCVKDIEEILHPKEGEEPIKRDTISWALWRMARDKKVNVVQKGRGRLPTIYSKNFA